MFSILGILSSAVSAMAGWLGLQKAKQERYNAPDMVSNKQAAIDLAEKEKIEKDLGNLEQERKDMAE